VRIGLGLSITMQGKNITTVAGTWILATGFWDDSGTYNDDSTWID